MSTSSGGARSVLEGSVWEAEWREWHAARERYATDPGGPASLAGTYWLLAGAGGELPGVAGVWAATGDAERPVRGTGLTGSGYRTGDGGPVGERIDLAAGEELFDGDRRFSVFARDDSYALRVFDPETAAGKRITGIDAFAPDPALRVTAVRETSGETETVTLVDGFQKDEVIDARFVFELDGEVLRLKARWNGSSYSVVFGDSTNGDLSYRFRFLRIEQPAEGDPWTIDFNRAFLPPCAFSDHFVCPLPPEGNRLPVAIRAGEQRLAVAGSAA
ncbi:DUF1684 domain-containing protein [Leucobacter celer]|uniref:DUF1684 domain-containing protein n=1 Tax=Leucobacter celer TaxID=668625 RepID=UPI0006A7E55A|nr:DUF1684 domain-containing protein [Leucobacter celer]